MTEAEWLACERADPLIWSLFSRGKGGGGRIKDERYRRFGIACVRRIVGALPGGQCPALDIAEAYIESPSPGGLARARKAHNTAMKAGAADAPFGERAKHYASSAVLKCFKSKPTAAALAWAEALEAMAAMQGQAEGWVPAYPRPQRQEEVERAERAYQASLVRDIFDSPFRKVIFSPDWRTDTAVSLARAMYDSRDFSAMPILADALQDAGCDNEAVLAHCRDAHQPHVRGCWVLTRVLDQS